ncbi:MAG: TolC family protein [Sphingobacteriales bacterium]|nr:MAG: TolC family protein [Sphingobacteriales bacterium]
MKQCCRFFILVLMLFTGLKTYAQDSVKIFSLEAFLSQVIYAHPVARQAQLKNQIAKQQLRFARSAFDPAIKGDYYHKNFDGKTYFTQTEANIVWPTWFGAEIKAGFENNYGAYLNPQETVPQQGLYGAGISVPLLNGFLFDTRRSALAQAKIMVSFTEAEQQQSVNKLLLEAAKTYAEWFKSYNVLQLKQEQFIIGENNLHAIRLRAKEGDLPYIDTVEAFTEKQRRLLDLRQAALNYNNARNDIAQFLWDENAQPVFLKKDIVPSADFNFRIKEDENVQVSIDRNFYIQQLNFKLQYLETEQRLWRENLKPTLNFQYQCLVPVAELNDAPFVTQGNKIGLQLSLPITWRKEACKNKMAGLKVDDAKFEIKNLQNNLLNDINNTKNTLQNLQNMLVMQNTIINGVEQLQAAEQQKFGMGESTFFMLNARENKLIDEKQKRFSLQSELLKHQAQYLYLTGRLTEKNIEK